MCVCVGGLCVCVVVVVVVCLCVTGYHPDLCSSPCRVWRGWPQVRWQLGWSVWRCVCVCVFVCWVCVSCVLECVENSLRVAGMR